MYCHFLLNVQNPYFLTIGGLLPLNWPTCVQVNILIEIITVTSIFYLIHLDLQLFKSIYYWINILRTMQ